LAHEITHVLQQRRGTLTVQRAPKTGTTGGNADPVCDTFDFDITRGLISTLAADYAKTKNTNTRLAVIRQIKLIRRCATPEQQQQVRTDLAGAIGTKEEGVVWVEAGTPLGGYTGMYPGFASDIKQRLEALGTSETYKFGTFDISGSGSTYRARAKAVASGEVPELARTDILYFRGHQYAQYRAPGLFADGSETYGFDLRYIEKVGGFPNVKLLISTSCATLCKEAFDVFHGLFPNAVILGYRKSAPLEGKAVRTALESKVKALARPLLLDEPVDVKAIILAWESVIEERHKGDTAQLPGYFSGGSIRYWDGAAWQVINPSDNANKCREKGDFSSYYPAPP